MNANERKKENIMSLIELKRNYLKAMLAVAAKSDIRYYLEGVYFVAEGSKVLAYSTDGRQMIRWLISDNYKGDDFEYIVSRRAIKDAIKTKYDLFLNKETGEMVCSKKGDFRQFNGLIDAKYPNVKKLVAACVDSIKQPKSDDILLDGNCLGSLSEVSKYIGKHHKAKMTPVRLYKQKSGTDICNIFTFGGIGDVIYIVASLSPEGVTEAEHYAVLMDNYTPPKTPTQIQLDKGNTVLCDVSDDSQKATCICPEGNVEIIAYDKDGYLDAHGNVWRYVCCTKMIEPSPETV